MTEQIERIATVHTVPGLTPGATMHVITYTQAGRDSGASYVTPEDLPAWREDLAEQGWTVVDAPPPSVAPPTPAAELRAAARRVRCTAGAHPTRAPLAELLDHLADDMSDYGASEVDSPGGGAVVVTADGEIRHDWTAALGLARAITSDLPKETT